MLRSISLIALVFASVITCLSLSAHAESIKFGSYQFTLKAPSDWVKPATIPEQPVAPREDFHTRILLTDEQVRFGAQGEQENYTHIALELRGAEALTELARWSVPFDPNYQSFSLHSFKRRRGLETSELALPAVVKIIHREEQLNQGLYQGQVNAFFVVDDLRVGDSVEFSYSVTGKNPIFGQHRLGFYSLQWRLDLARVSVRVLDQGGAGLNFKALNSALTPLVNKRDGSAEYQWQQDGVTGQQYEPDAPIWYNPAARLQLSDFRDWQDVARWADALFVVPAKLPHELEKLVMQWKAEATTPAERASRALRFVQDEIRYFGIEVAVNAYRPFPPDEVLRRRYGDCKDKALLLVTLLRALGLEAYPALVNSEARQRLAEFLPGAAAFDHAIAVTYVDGKAYWLDGTARYQHGKLDNIGFFNYGLALVVKANTRGLTEVVAAKTPLAAVEVEQRFEAKNFIDPVVMQVQTHYRGSEAERIRARLASGRDQLSKEFLNYYKRLHPATETDAEFSIEDDGSSNTVILRERYRLERFFEKYDGGVRFSASGSELYGFSRLPSAIARQSPLGLYHPINLTQRQIFDLPAHQPLTIPEPNLAIDGDGFRYVRQIGQASDQLTIEHSYQAQAASLSPGQVRDHVERLRRMDQALGMQISLPVAPAQENQQRLQSLIKGLLDKRSKQ